MSLFELMEGGFEKAKAYRELQQALQAKKLPAAVFDLNDGAKVMLCALLSKGKRSVVVTPTDQRALQLTQDLHEMGLRALHLPAREQTFYHLAAESRDLIQTRIAAFGECLETDAPLVICAPMHALMQPMVAPDVFKRYAIVLKPGMEIALEELLLRLVQAGYQREEVVESKGQFALRGGILDVFPVQGQNAFRVEFFGDEVDTIREMDALTQRSIDTCNSLSILPSTEALCDLQDMKRAADALRKLMGAPDEGDEEIDPTTFMPWLTLEDEEEEGAKEIRPLKGHRMEEAARHLEQGEAFEGMEAYLPFLSTKLFSAFAYIEPSIVLMEEAGRIREGAKGLEERFARELSEAIERGEGFKEQQKNLFSYEELIESCRKYPLVALGNLQVAVPDMHFKQVLHLPTRQMPEFMGQHQLLMEQLLMFRQQQLACVLFAGGQARASRLRETLVQRGFAVVENGEPGPGQVLISSAGFSKGFELPDAGFAVFGETELFGSMRQRANPRRRRAGQKIAAFTDLKPGDYVVHENHGVGIYVGTERIAVQGTSRDYLHIQYGGSDKLYVPTDQLDRIQKYIGIKDAPPRLNKLGGTEWERAKQRVKSTLMEMAKELLELYAARQQIRGFAFAKDAPWQREFEDAFPYEETPDQLQCASEIKQDMEKPIVMDRLLCGDVGYGKTEVAVRAAFKAVLDSKQVAVLVPTTILAQQHFETFKKRFAGFPVQIEMLSRFRTAAEQRSIIERVKLGKVDILIGTHRLLGKDLSFKDLGLLIVDEEQRFGVKHKESLKQLKQIVDVLTLSATPIPRTLHMSMVGIRDMSLLETPPEERYPVQTYVMEYSDSLLRDAVNREIARGGQVYILYNRVRSIERFHAHVQSLAPTARIAVGHGQMRETELEDVMLDFYEGNTDVLICSTIIESGLDVQNANTLIVMDADRFGLSQLYQLRGRVGRSNRLAYCYMTVRPDKVITEQAEKRLSAIREFTEFGSGFKIAMRDLEIRGAGNLLGAQQHGHMSEVGYDLYVKMMEETVKELKGEETQTSGIDAKVELAIDAYLPMEFVQGDGLRMDVYKRIATIKSRDDFSDVLEELIDRFGDVPEEVENLLWIALLKAGMEKIGLDSAFLRGNQLIFRFSPFAKVDGAALVQSLNNMDGEFVLQNAQPPCLLLRRQEQMKEMMNEAITALEKLRSGMQAPPQEA